jgi:hypothetical protein
MRQNPQDTLAKNRSFMSFEDIRIGAGDTATTKPFCRADEVGLKQVSARMVLDQTTGCDHVGLHHQPYL